MMLTRILESLAIVAVMLIDSDDIIISYLKIVICRPSVSSMTYALHWV